MYYKDESVFVEKKDQCITCKNFAQGVACPLLHALAMGVVSFDGTLYVSNCGFYEEYTRTLHIIKDDAVEFKKNKPKKTDKIKKFKRKDTEK